MKEKEYVVILRALSGFIFLESPSIFGYVFCGMWLELKLIDFTAKPV